MSADLVDPLLVLLRRHEASNAAFDAAADGNVSEVEKTHLFAAWLGVEDPLQFFCALSPDSALPQGAPVIPAGA